jgi:hypothetical protein
MPNSANEDGEDNLALDSVCADADDNDELLTKYPHYEGQSAGRSWASCVVDGVQWKAKASERNARIGGSQSRYLQIPPVFLPSDRDET